MPSPFPGMDPWLETRWESIHMSLCVYASDLLNRQLTDNYQATVDKRVVVQADAGERSIRPDISVFRAGGESFVTFSGDGGGTTALAEADVALEPVTVALRPVEINQYFVEIRDYDGRLFTVVEFVSPTNKRPGDGLDKYRQKQAECRVCGVSLVEIDLTRAGRRQLLALPVHLPDRARTTYQASVFRSWKPHQVQAWPMPLRHALPSIPVPVTETEAEPKLELQTLVTQAYDNGRYGRVLRYDDPPSPPLSPDDAAWANEVVQRARQAASRT